MEEKQAKEMFKSLFLWVIENRIEWLEEIIKEKKIQLGVYDGRQI